ncbi:MAG: DUF4097 domain-containing protein [bacterium]|nr:DUF4097 domain-containing protein [bacterium]
MKHFKQTKVLLVVILGALFLMPNLYAEKKTINKTFKAAKSVTLSLVSGDCVINKGGSGEVKVTLVHNYSSDRFEAIMNKEGSRIVLKEKFRGRGHSFRNNSSTWTITVPAKTDIDFSSASGDFKVTGLSAKLDAESASGDLVISDCKGTLEAKTASGDVRLKKSSGTITAKSASGDVRLKKSSGTINAKSASGDVIAKDVVFDGESKLKSASGDVIIELAESCQHELNLSTVTGDIRLDYNGNAIKGYFLFKGKKDNIKSPIAFENNESGYSPFVKRYFKKGGSSPEISLKTVTGDLTLIK